MTVSTAWSPTAGLPGVLLDGPTSTSGPGSESGTFSDTEVISIEVDRPVIFSGGTGPDDGTGAAFLDLGASAWSWAACLVTVEVAKAERADVEGFDVVDLDADVDEDLETFSPDACKGAEFCAIVGANEVCKSKTLSQVALAFKVAFVNFWQ